MYPRSYSWRAWGSWMLSWPVRFCFYRDNNILSMFSVESDWLDRNLGEQHPIPNPVQKEHRPDHEKWSQESAAEQRRSSSAKLERVRTIEWRGRLSISRLICIGSTWPASPWRSDQNSGQSFEKRGKWKGLARVGMSFALNVKEQEAGVTREVRWMTSDLIQREWGEDTLEKTREQPQYFPVAPLSLMKEYYLPTVSGVVFSKQRLINRLWNQFSGLWLAFIRK